jgi:hypothetical protein
MVENMRARTPRETHSKRNTKRAIELYIECWHVEFDFLQGVNFEKLYN